MKTLVFIPAVFTLFIISKAAAAPQGYTPLQNALEKKKVPKCGINAQSCTPPGHFSTKAACHKECFCGKGNFDALCHGFCAFKYQGCGFNGYWFCEGAYPSKAVEPETGPPC